MHKKLLADANNTMKKFKITRFLSTIKYYEDKDEYYKDCKDEPRLIQRIIWRRKIRISIQEIDTGVCRVRTDKNWENMEKVDIRVCLKKTDKIWKSTLNNKWEIIMKKESSAMLFLS